MEISLNAMNWLAIGERGVSSETMFVILASCGLVQGRIFSPFDPDDFQRCEKLLRQVPEFRERLPLMRSRSEEWDRLVENWDLIVETFEREVPGIFGGLNHGWHAIETYKLMRKIYAEAGL